MLTILLSSTAIKPSDSEASVADRPTMVFDTRAIKGGEKDKETCPRCLGKVFHAERMLSKNHSFHKVTKMIMLVVSLSS